MKSGDRLDSRAAEPTEKIRFISQPIRVILFDLDGTLRHNVPPSMSTFYDYAVQLGIRDGKSKRREAARWTHYYWAQSDELSNDYQEFDGDETGFWENYAVRSLVVFGCDHRCAEQHAAKIIRFMREEYKPEDHVLDHVPDTLEYLLNSGYRLGVLSNRENPCQDYLDELDLMQYFELSLVAGEVGAWKPDPLIFEKALEQFGCHPVHAVYIGDNYYADVIGAQRAGLQPVLFDPEGIFPGADCQVIQSFDQLSEFL